MLKHILPYHHDSARLFEKIAHRPWAMFLDSGQMLNPATGLPGSQYGRYDILVADPVITLVTKGQQTIIEEQMSRHVSSDDPFTLLNQVLRRFPKTQTETVFAGGAVGYFGYDLARRLEPLTESRQPETMPEMMIGIFDWAVVVDHRLKTCQLVSHTFSAQTTQAWPSLCQLFASTDDEVPAPFYVNGPISANFSQPQYANAFQAVQSYIKNGDCYQVNLAQRFNAQVSGDAWTAYRQLRQISPAPFMAFMQLPIDNHSDFQVLSNSPERFVQVLGEHVETRPIKGTRPRAADEKTDLANAAELINSTKDRAENVMIVDLLRNDLGKTCVIGSVKVEQLFQLQSFANVHHLVSTVTGHLIPDASAIDLLRGCFPGGSITGAPKVRAMQIINELEPDCRGIYCGAIGYIGFDGNMDTNIAIRTAVVMQGQFSFYAGGGIVADSVCDKEYKETMDKAASMLKILQQFRG